jgi:twitching motility two-component system response regulator PilH
VRPILIVDDVPTDRELIGKIVTKSGYEVIYAKDGAEALDIAKEQMPAMIFMDVVMPNRDGFATCRTLRSDPVTQDIPVVLVTSKNTESDRFWGNKQGASDHVGKPFSPGALMAAIQRWAK